MKVQLMSRKTVVVGWLMMCLMITNVVAKPYTIEVSKEQIEDLNQRLRNTRWPDELNDVENLEQGISNSVLKEYVDYWLNDYDWEKQLAYLNSFDHHFDEELNVHYILSKAEKKDDSLPIDGLLMVHGWPGSFVECLGVIPKYNALGIDVVCPSLPGYGLSPAPTEKGENPRAMGSRFIKLMKKLGYNQYLAQAGDWGALITSLLCRDDPEHCAGLHVNLFAFLPPIGKGFFASIKVALHIWKPHWFFDEADQKSVPDVADFFEISGYFHQQATKPQTLGFALNDSPTGLLGWILEKFYDWTDPQLDLDKDVILNNVMLYWMTESATSSARLYWEAVHTETEKMWALVTVDVPTSYARFRHEIHKAPRAWLEYYYSNLVRLTDIPSGGHFPALETPTALVDDVYEFIKLLDTLDSENDEL